MVKGLPLSSLLLETDGPWCEIRATHASAPFAKTTYPTVKKPEKWQPGSCVKGRQEPAHIVAVAEVVAHLQGLTLPELGAAVKANTERVFAGLCGEL